KSYHRQFRERDRGGSRRRISRAIDTEQRPIGNGRGPIRAGNARARAYKDGRRVSRMDCDPGDRAAAEGSSVYRKTRARRSVGKGRVDRALQISKRACSGGCIVNAIETHSGKRITTQVCLTGSDVENVMIRGSDG